MENIDELAKVASAIGETDGVSITLSDGREIQIYKCKTKQVGMVLKLVASLFEQMGIKVLGEIPKLDLENPTILLQLIANSTFSLFSVAVELCSIESLEKFEELDVDDSLAIMLKEFEVNKSFFLTRVLPMIGVAGMEQAPGSPPKRRSRRS